MSRFRQFLFAGSFLALSWLGMMAVHELGHVIGALVTGGNVQRVVLRPLAISRTDVSPNPSPAIVVWLGPLVGCLIPLAIHAIIPRRHTTPRTLACFFAGFCLIANGAYIASGAFTGVGDCGEMHRTGTPLWLMLAFGAVTMPAGLFLWHGLGSMRRFLDDPTIVTPRLVCVTFGAMIAACVLAVVLSPP